MPQLYNSIGFCAYCARDKVKMHARINDVPACMRCYTKERLKDPKNRERARKHAYSYYLRNRDVINAKNRIRAAKRRKKRKKG